MLSVLEKQIFDTKETVEVINARLLDRGVLLQAGHPTATKVTVLKVKLPSS